MARSGSTPRKKLAEPAGSGEMDLSEFRAAKAANDRKIGALRQVLAKSAERKLKSGPGRRLWTFGPNGTSWISRTGAA